MNLKIDPNLIKGFLDYQEGEALYHLAKECSSIGPLLEIGSYCGKSALYNFSPGSALFLKEWGS